MSGEEGLDALVRLEVEVDLDFRGRAQREVNLALKGFRKRLHPSSLMGFFIYRAACGKSAMT